MANVKGWTNRLLRSTMLTIWIESQTQTFQISIILVFEGIKFRTGIKLF